MDKPMSFQEFLSGRICKGDQARQDYEDYLASFEDEEDKEGE